MSTQDKTTRIVLWILLIFCMLVLTKYILFKRPPHYYKEFFIGNNNVEIIKRGWKKANLEPFSSIRFFYRVGSGFLTKNILGNIVGFIPLGILLPALFSRLRRWWKTTLFIFILSALFEVTQLITGWGLFDVDDIILNSFGGWVGFVIFYIGTKALILDHRAREG